MSDGPDFDTSESRRESYDSYLAQIGTLYDQVRNIYENLDRWALTLSGSGLGIIVAGASLSPGIARSHPLTFRTVVVTFAAALCIALVGKVCSYLSAWSDLRQVHLVYKRRPDDFVRYYHRVKSKQIDRRNCRYLILSISTYSLILVGMVSIVIAALGPIPVACTPPFVGERNAAAKSSTQTSPATRAATGTESSAPPASSTSAVTAID